MPKTQQKLSWLIFAFISFLVFGVIFWQLGKISFLKETKAQTTPLLSCSSQGGQGGYQGSGCYESCTGDHQKSLPQGDAYCYQRISNWGMGPYQRCCAFTPCQEIGGDGCTKEIGQGGTEKTDGNKYCQSFSQGNTNYCVKCESGYRYDEKTHNCLVIPCTDSDAGENIYQKGICTDAILTDTDYCWDPTILFEPTILNEYYCENNRCKPKLIDCFQENKICKEGVCQESTLPPQPPVILSGPKGRVLSSETTAKFTYQSIGASLYRARVDSGSWSVWSGETSAIYQNLGGGSHSFEVQAKNVFGESKITSQIWEINRIVRQAVYSYITEGGYVNSSAGSIRSDETIKIQKGNLLMVNFPRQDEDSERVTYHLNLEKSHFPNRSVSQSEERLGIEILEEGNWNIVIDANDPLEKYTFQFTLSVIAISDPLFTTDLKFQYKIRESVTLSITAISPSGNNLKILIRPKLEGDPEERVYTRNLEAGALEKQWQFYWPKLPVIFFGENRHDITLSYDPEIIIGARTRRELVITGTPNYGDSEATQLAYVVRDLLAEATSPTATTTDLVTYEYTLRLKAIRSLEKLAAMELTNDEFNKVADIFGFGGWQTRIWREFQIPVINHTRPFSADEMRAIYNGFSAVSRRLWGRPVVFLGIAGGGGFYGGWFIGKEDYRLILLETGTFLAGTNPAFIANIGIIFHEIGHLIHYRVKGAKEQWMPLWEASDQNNPDDFAPGLHWTNNKWYEDFAETNRSWGNNSRALINRAIDIARQKNRVILLKKVLLYADIYSQGTNKIVFFQFTGPLTVEIYPNIPITRDSQNRIVSIEGIDVSFVWGSPSFKVTAVNPPLTPEDFDFNCDQKINIQDLGILFSYWDKSGSEIENYKHWNCPDIKSLDFSGDAKIGNEDFSILISNWKP